MKKKVAKQSKTSKPNYICDEVASKKPERHESQPTSRNQEDFGRCLHLDQSHLSILSSITDNIRDMNLKTKFTVLEIQFRHVNHTNVAMICKNIEQNKPFLWWLWKWKQCITVLKVSKMFWIFISNFNIIFNMTKQIFHASRLFLAAAFSSVCYFHCFDDLVEMVFPINVFRKTVFPFFENFAMQILQ